MSHRWMRGPLVLSGLLAVLIVVGTAGSAAAHPLGNFTTNVYGGIVVRPDEVVVDYVVDMAEIPTFQERARIDTDTDGTLGRTEAASYREATCTRLAGGVALAIDGTPVSLEPGPNALSFPPGTGELSTLRLECRLSATATVSESGVSLSYEDGNYRGRLGWREVSAVGDGATIVASDVPAASVSRRLTSYPKDALPLSVTSAVFEATPGGPRLPALPGPGSSEVLAQAPGRDVGVLADFAGRGDVSIGLIVVMLFVAVGVGALHALGPGHGKTLIGAYLVGGGGTFRQAVAVGGAVAVMHTASTLGLALLVAGAERVFPAERVYPWLGLASGLVALALGSWLLVSRIHAAGWRTHEHGEETAGDTHGHEHNHEHPHPSPNRPLSRRGLVALAFSGGILPSTSALVVLLTSISLGRTALGLMLIAAFSLGLAGSLIAVGAVALRARSMATRRLPARIVGWAPVGSAAAIAVVGVVLTARGLLQI